MISGDHIVNKIKNTTSLYVYNLYDDHLSYNTGLEVNMNETTGDQYQNFEHQTAMMNCLTCTTVPHCIKEFQRNSSNEGIYR